MATMAVVTVIPGDGIGPEVMAAALRVLRAAGVAIEADEQLAGVTAIEKLNDPLPSPTLDSIRRNRVALKGPLTTPIGTGFRSVNVALRQEFDLYANVRPARTIVPGRYDGIDLVLIRENTEGLYVGVEHYIGLAGDRRAAAESVMIITRFGSERIVRYAFEYALRERRRKVTLVHKANILKLTQGLFLDVGREIAREYEGRIAFDDHIIDATAMRLVLDPGRFDVLVTENMFGDILSDEMAGLIGGLGFAAAANIGTDIAIFEAVHGSAPDIAGTGRANPTALILAACLMLEHLDDRETAGRIRTAVNAAHAAVRTIDRGGQATTEDFTTAVVREIEKGR
jgi:isocitrate dehydrogenase (NAD+)